MIVKFNQCSQIKNFSLAPNYHIVYITPMKLINRSLLIDFMKKHSDSKGWIDNWISDVENSKWTRPLEIKNRYSSASIISNSTVIFNVKGNKYRLEVIIAYQTGVVFVKNIETHAQYTRRLKKRK